MTSNEFYKQYRENHYCCPKCHAKFYESTLAAYIYNPEKPDDYKDYNSVKCCVCGWEGICHDLAPKPKEIGYRVGFTDYVNLVRNIDDNIYTKDKANYLMNKLNDEQNPKGGHYTYYEVEIN